MRPLYESDTFAWSEQQAEALRSLSTSAVARDVDWDRVADGIEAVGDYVRGRVEDALRRIFKHAISGFCDFDSPLHAQRSMETLRAGFDLEDDLTPTMRPRLNLDRLWLEAFEQAMREVPPRVLGVPPSIPRTCPFALDDLLAEEFSYDWAVKRLYVLLTRWRPKAEQEPNR